MPRILPLDGIQYLTFSFFVDFDEEMGSEEESGKDWSELEEEAAKGRLETLRFVMVTGVNGVQFGL